jgi:hypothetical protein
MQHAISHKKNYRNKGPGIKVDETTPDGIERLNWEKNETTEDPAISSAGISTKVAKYHPNKINYQAKLSSKKTPDGIPSFATHDATTSSSKQSSKSDTSKKTKGGSFALIGRGIIPSLSGIAQNKSLNGIAQKSSLSASTVGNKFSAVPYKKKLISFNG